MCKFFFTQQSLKFLKASFHNLNETSIREAPLLARVQNLFHQVRYNLELNLVGSDLDQEKLRKLDKMTVDQIASLMDIYAQGEKKQENQLHHSPKSIVSPFVQQEDKLHDDWSKWSFIFYQHRDHFLELVDSGQTYHATVYKLKTLDNDWLLANKSLSALIELQELSGNDKSLNVYAEIDSAFNILNLLLIIVLGGVGMNYYFAMLRIEKEEKIREENYKTINDHKLSLSFAHHSKLISIGEMSAGIAHEINNPLTIISMSLAHMSKNLNDSKRTAELVNTMCKALDRIKKNIVSMQRFSHVTSINDFNAHSLNEIISNCMCLTAFKAKQENTIIKLDLQNNISISCNSLEIEQVLFNLINNAIDAVKNLDEKWIKVELTDGYDVVILRVTDSGEGIPEDLKVKLFDPFFTTKPVGEGTGLGLSLCKSILSKHNASICILTNSPNTCFEIRFTKLAEKLAA